MKILLDECVPQKFKKDLEEFDVSTVAELHWKGIKNGQLLQLMVDNHFDILLTIDKNLKYEQDIGKFPITIIILRVVRSKVELMRLLIPHLKRKIRFMKKSYVYEIWPD